MIFLIEILLLVFSVWHAPTVWIPCVSEVTNQANYIKQLTI